MRARFLGQSPGLVLAMFPLAALAGLLIARGDGLLVGTFAVSVLLLVISGLRLPRILGLTGALLLIPSTAIIVGVSSQGLLVAGEIVLAVAVLLGRRRQLDHWILWTGAFFVILLGFSAQRSAAAGDALLSPMQGLLSIGSAVALLAAGAGRPSDRQEVQELARTLYLWGVPLAVWAIAENVLGRALTYTPLSYGRRAIGPVGNPNYFGLLLAELAVLSFGLARVMRMEERRWLAPAATGVLCSVGVVATLSRGAIVGLLAGVIALWAQGLSRPRRKLVWAGILVVALALGPLALREFTSTRLRIAYPGLVVAPNLEADSGRVRVLAAELGVTYALEDPWTGVGLERFAVLAQRDPRLGVYANTHNEPVRIAAEAGIPALILLGVFVWLVMARIRRRPPSVVRIVAPVIVCYGAASLLLNGLDSAAVTYPVVAAMFLAAGSERQGAGQAGRPTEFREVR